MFRNGSIHCLAGVLGWAGLMLSDASAAVCDRALSQLRLTQWTVDDGLPLDGVYAMAQTADRFIWVGTEDGLARFDGRDFARVNLSGLQNNSPEYVQSLAVDDDGRLLAGTVSPGLIHVSGLAPRLESMPVAPHRMLPAEGGGLWIGTRAEGLWYQPASGESPAPVVGTRSSWVNALAPRQEGGVWVGYGDAGFQYHDGTALEPGESIPPGARELSVLALREDRTGTLWIGAREGLFSLRHGRLRQHTALESPVSVLLEDRAGILWAGLADGGVVRFCDGVSGEVDRLDHELGLPAGPVKDLLQDADGSVWVATHGGGIAQLARGAVLPITSAQGLPEAPILGVLQASDGDVWAATFGGGLAHMGSESTEVLTQSDGLASDWVFSLAEGPGGDLWAGTRRGITRVRDGRPRGDAEGDPAGISRTVVSLLHDGDRLWLGTTAGLLSLQDGEIDRHAVVGEPLAAAVIQLHRDASGVLWVGTDGDGLYRLAEDGLRRPAFHEALPNPMVKAFHEQTDGVLWVATAGGLLRWDGQAVGTVTAAQGLPDPQILSMLDDGLGYFWLSGNRGVFRVRREDLQAAAISGAGLDTVERFTRADGMPRTETNGGFQPAAWRGADGRLWYPTTDGIAVFDPAMLADGSRTPSVHLWELYSDGQRLEPDGELQLGPRPGPLQLRFTVPEYLFPQRVSFRYRMAGMDADWYQTKERQVLYHQLSPGSLRFEVQARVGRGPWSNPESLSVNVRRHLLDSPLFWLLLGGVALALALLGYHLHARQRQRRLMRLQQLQKLESVGLLASGVAHDFNNVLQGVIAGAESLQVRVRPDTPEWKDAEGILQAAEQGVGLARQLLTFARQQPGEPRPLSLQQELLGTESFLRRLVPANLQFTLRADCDVGVCLIDPVQLRQVLLNLVGNAGDALAEGGEIHVELAPADEGWARIRVTDTGPGIPREAMDRLFEPFFTTKAPGKGTGLGLAVSYGIVRRAGGRIKVSTRPGSGACFDVLLPVSGQAKDLAH